MTSSTAHPGTVAAVDLGATSGRVIVGHVGPNQLHLQHIARFPNTPVRRQENGRSTLRWDINDLKKRILQGIALAIQNAPDTTSVGIDSWGVDYGLISEGKLIDAPYHYRDERTSSVFRAFHELASEAELYGSNGIQPMPINTGYQLRDDRLTGRLARAKTFLLIPDLIVHWLTGEQQAERTIASTSGLLSTTGMWNTELLDKLEIPASVLPRLTTAGAQSAPMLRPVLKTLNAQTDLLVSTVASHDTASAVVAIPRLDESSAYVSCGTWGLVGIELEAPVVSDNARTAGFTNELGADGSIRFLRNVMGLWILNETLRSWAREGEDIDLNLLLLQARAHPLPEYLFDPNDQTFFAAANMPKAIATWFNTRALPAPTTKPGWVRCIVESLASEFANTVASAAEIAGRDIHRIAVVGGGSQNELLCQAIADRSGKPVFAGPAEATAIGNVLVQARALGQITGDLASLRAIVQTSLPQRKYNPIVSS
jgi:rhamnulokinase